MILVMIIIMKIVMIIIMIMMTRHTPRCLKHCLLQMRHFSAVHPESRGCIWKPDIASCQRGREYKDSDYFPVNKPNARQLFSQLDLQSLPSESRLQKRSAATITMIIYIFSRSVYLCLNVLLFLTIPSITRVSTYFSSQYPLSHPPSLPPHLLSPYLSSPTPHLPSTPGVNSDKPHYKRCHNRDKRHYTPCPFGSRCYHGPISVSPLWAIQPGLEASAGGTSTQDWIPCCACLSCCSCCSCFVFSAAAASTVSPAALQPSYVLPAPLILLFLLPLFSWLSLFTLLPCFPCRFCCPRCPSCSYFPLLSRCPCWSCRQPVRG